MREMPLSGLKEMKTVILFITEFQKLDPSVESLNSTSLPSRIFSVEYLKKSLWWEGPLWLRKPPEFWSKDVIDPDNCVTSVEDQENLKKFIHKSKLLFETAKFALRGWKHNILNPKIKNSVPAYYSSFRVEMGFE